MLFMSGSARKAFTPRIPCNTHRVTTSHKQRGVEGTVCGASYYSHLTAL